MLGLDNPIHIGFILVLLLLVFGAKRLPEMGRSLGAGLRGFKESISGEHDLTADLTAAPSPTALPATNVAAAPVTAAPPIADAGQQTAAAAVVPGIAPEPVVVGQPSREPLPVSRV